ncbi:MAG: hypothetical protein IT372_05170 [Polyangiaceae bacterium]|nr:hypothetical protein [Polyangiaceae bacterium]
MKSTPRPTPMPGSLALYPAKQRKRPVLVIAVNDDGCTILDMGDGKPIKEVAVKDLRVIPPLI